MCHIYVIVIQMLEMCTIYFSQLDENLGNAMFTI